MDLATLDVAAPSEAGSVLELRHPTTDALLVDGNGAALTLTLSGSDSERFQRAGRAATNRRLKTQATRRGVLTAEVLEAETIDTLVACTIAWSGITLDGESLPLNDANARKVYSKLRWVREQADAFINDRSNFLKASPSS